MDEDVGSLYPRYVQAVEYLNDRLNGLDLSPRAHQALRLKVLSLVEFGSWWSWVAKERELRARWLDRFANPAAQFSRSCEQLRSIFARLPITRSAA